MISERIIPIIIIPVAAAAFALGGTVQRNLGSSDRYEYIPKNIDFAYDFSNNVYACFMYHYRESLENPIAWRYRIEDDGNVSFLYNNKKRIMCSNYYIVVIENGLGPVTIAHDRFYESEKENE